jgi:hypothetical protein
MVRFVLLLFALHHDPALPEYENHGKKAKEGSDRVQRQAPGLAGDGDRPLPFLCPAI